MTMISKFNSKLEYQIKIGKLSITRFVGFSFCCPSSPLFSVSSSLSEESLESEGESDESEEDNEDGSEGGFCFPAPFLLGLLRPEPSLEGNFNSLVFIFEGTELLELEA